MKRKTPWRCASLLALALAGGCASPQFSRIDSNRELYESWPIEVRQAVLDGRAEPGMTPDMVRMALGKPSEIVDGAAGVSGEEIWIYRKGGDVDQSGMMGYPSSYPGSTYPGSTYPGGGIGTVSGPGIGISTGTGGTGISTSVGSGIGITTGVGAGGGIGIITPSIGIGSGTGVMSPMPMPVAPGVDREVVFRDGVVFRADNPDLKK